MISPIFYTDFYKTDHRRQYPEGTTKVYSNFTPRSSRVKGVDEIVVFGIRAFLHRLQFCFEENFFRMDGAWIINGYDDFMDECLGKGAIDSTHLMALHDLQYLPLEIKALPEGTLCPIGIPVLTITNTHPNFAWLPNFLETFISNSLWHPMTSATIAHEYREILDLYAARTSDIPEFVDWQGHDFSMRGHTCIDSAAISGAAHLLSFNGTDTIPAITFLKHHYEATGLIGGSVPATEHSVMCLGGQESEYDTYKRLITETYPKGIISIVSDTWDYWNVLDTTIRSLKDVIMARDGKVVIRPDSGDPEEILCGDVFLSRCPLGNKGTLEVLWDIFGGTINSKGYRQLDPHIGVIYGDSITLERCWSICNRMEQMGFASTNVVFGIGSYTYQYVTRDTFGFAMKATYGEVNGEPRIIFKDPKTDNGMKKSAKGLLHVTEDLKLIENVTPELEKTGALKTVFLNGVCVGSVSLSTIRDKLMKGKK